MIYYGIADAHGLESFLPARIDLDVGGFNIDPRELAMMVLRAQANAQRHAVVYQVNIAVQDARDIQKALDAGEFTEALLELKSRAKEVKLARSSGLNAEKAWHKIPNPDLDPFH
jgi:hypothetical protein